jgi:hypothetical protein
MKPEDGPVENPGDDQVVPGAEANPQPEPNPDAAANVEPERNPEDADPDVDPILLVEAPRDMDLSVAVSLRPKAVLLQNWFLICDWYEAESGAVVPYYTLGGQVFGHPNHADGDYIQHTSRIVHYEFHTVLTVTGRVYRLGRPHPTYREKRTKLDRLDPLKGLMLPAIS